ncbi:unnamed protein product [marine sediment metagenome]|uniref:Uncharacterized protein n=1 Tax=marine sediment metagenome TaxID=412755 RepID=X1KN93_9ZZZZ
MIAREKVRELREAILVSSQAAKDHAKNRGLSVKSRDHARGESRAYYVVVELLDLLLLDA